MSPLCNIGTKSMQNTSAYEEPRSSGKQLHEYSFDPRSIHQSLIKLILYPGPITRGKYAIMKIHRFE